MVGHLKSVKNPLILISTFTIEYVPAIEAIVLLQFDELLSFFLHEKIIGRRMRDARIFVFINFI